MEDGSRVIPLLDKVYFEDCPGCKIEKRKDTQQAIPWKTLISVWMIVLCNALPASSLFPFLYFMIRDFHIAEQEEDMGYYAGFVASTFMFGRALTSIFWGLLADRYGRKPIIIIGTTTVVIFQHYVWSECKLLDGSLNKIYFRMSMWIDWACKGICI